MPKFIIQKRFLERHCLPCPICGKQMKRIGAKHCQECYRKYKLRKFPKGKEHYNWKGGKWTDPHGYIHILVEGTGRYAPEHRLVWEQIHNRKLPPHWVIHHLNGIKNDNRTENLIALPRNKHSVWTLVELAQKRIRELEQLRLNL